MQSEARILIGFGLSARYFTGLSNRVTEDPASETAKARQWWFDASWQQHPASQNPTTNCEDVPKSWDIPPQPSDEKKDYPSRLVCERFHRAYKQAADEVLHDWWMGERAALAKLLEKGKKVWEDDIDWRAYYNPSCHRGGFYFFGLDVQHERDGRDYSSECPNFPGPGEHTF